MTVERRVVAGQLGWSNKRTGCEFYSDVEDARWREPREAYLTDELGDPEGCRVIVIVARDRFDDLTELGVKVTALVREHDEASVRSSASEDGFLSATHGTDAEVDDR